MTTISSQVRRAAAASERRQARRGRPRRRRSFLLKVGMVSCSALSTSLLLAQPIIEWSTLAPR